MSCTLPQHPQYLELFLAFNPFYIEEPSNLLFFFFPLFCAEEYPSIFSDCGWVVFRNWAGLFEQWPFRLLSLRFHTQVWAPGLVPALVCVFLNGSSYRKVAEVSSAGPGGKDRSWTPPAEMTTWPWPGKGTTPWHGLSSPHLWSVKSQNSEVNLE